jgi:hypothetical protein
VGALAVLLLIAGIGVAAWQWRVSIQRARLPMPTPPPTGERAIDQALAAAEDDSAAIKHRWIEVVSGIELAGLTPAKRDLFLRFANAESCTCGCGYTLAGCRASDMSCAVSGPRLEALLDSVRAGRITRADGVRERPHAER